ncbi:MAG: cobaltochelatase subunit CobN, partial [Chloroflexi bacterium]|nr:cobaltochelatase subunit CobN [Chloroflexota bacterium]
FKDTPDGAGPLRYQAVPDRCERVAALAMRFAALRRKPAAEKRIAFVLTNSTQKAVKVGNAVGLDAGASLLALLTALREAGYTVGEVPTDADALLHELIDRGAYEGPTLRPDQLVRAAHLPAATYRRWQAELPPTSQAQMNERWGPPPGEALLTPAGDLAVPHLQFGNIVVALQPTRGYGLDPNAIYHLPDLSPPHSYHAFYRWLRDEFRADAIVHLGKHGTLEWLPGKGVGLSAACFPDAFLADLPLFYPFIINDPGEGTQAKRRTHAVIIDHLMPPLTQAGAYGELAALAQLIDEYYQVEQTDPSKLPILQQQIWQLIKQAHLDSDVQTILNWDSTTHVHPWEPTVTEDGTPVSLTEMRGKDFAHLLENIDGYLCELTGAQIRGGLHVLGRVPAGEELVDLLVQLVRLPNLNAPSLPAAVAASLGYQLEALLEAPGKRLERVRQGGPITASDALERIDAIARALLADLAAAAFQPSAVPAVVARHLGPSAVPEVAAVLQFVCTDLLPRLQRAEDELTNLLRALDGRFVPPGPSGAPSRGMVHVLPTGRNFFAIDPRALPSQAAWQVGSQLARELLERYLAEEGRYPEQVGISVWGTSAIRTQGDDIAQVFALLGVRPIWQPESRRLIGVTPVPLAELGRPRIDVVLRISGFFRDAFPHLIALVDEAIQLVAGLEEPLDQNYVRRHILAEEERRRAAGEPTEPARYRIFGAKPGTYGAGLLPLIDAQNWQSEADLAAVYVEWGGYAYTADRYGVDARAEFQRALAGVEVAVKNQDNREHDLFDSDDYFQFHGGMVAVIRALTGRRPKVYFGDSSNPARPRVRDLAEEAKRVFRSRVVNPKWIRAMEKHGFKGALELAATVDYLFGYDATADVLEDWMYERLAAAYLLDRETRAFLERTNPWALQGIAERLLEAAQRGLWEQPNPETLAALRAIALAADATLEARSE